MPIRLKPTAQIVDKYVRQAAGATADYKSGVQTPKRDQAEAAAASADSYAQGVQAAIADNRFQTGVQAAGTAKWTRKAAGVGADRYAGGVQAAKTDYQSGVEPYLQTISGLDLPPRRPRGDPGNIQRVQAVNAALRARKVAGR
ncbi:MAG: hypothetical protein ACRD2K_03850 [Terriglobales bacterium]